MQIELKGVVKYHDDGHKYVDVLVSVDGFEMFERKQVAVDVKVSPGKIRQFLAELYDVNQGQIIWPEHIQQKDF